MPFDLISLSEHRYMRIEWSDGLTQDDIAHLAESLQLFIKKLPRFKAQENRPHAERGECSGPLPGRNVTAVQTGEKTLLLAYLTPRDEGERFAQEDAQREHEGIRQGE